MVQNVVLERSGSVANVTGGFLESSMVDDDDDDGGWVVAGEGGPGSGLVSTSESDGTIRVTIFSPPLISRRSERKKKAHPH